MIEAIRIIARTAASILFYVAVPLALVLGNVRWLVYSEAHYLRGYDRHGVRESTGMSPAELERATQEIQAYFRDGTPISLEIQKETGRAPLFNERELHHLSDVRGLLNGLFTTQAIAVAYIVLFGALCFRWHRGRGIYAIAAESFNASMLTVLLLAGAGIVASTNFQQLFIQFHLLSFDNDLWILDPRTDYMIRMFPQGFWFESAIQVAGMTVIEALLIAGASFIVRARSGSQPVVIPS